MTETGTAQALNAVRNTAVDYREAESNLWEAVLDALNAGVSAAAIAREAELPYAQVLGARRYA